MYALVARPGPRRRLFRLGGLGDIVSDLSQAIARFEGFYSPNTIAQRNNNPGNLRAGPGAIGTDAAGYAIFPDVATGWAALNSQVSLNISRGLTLGEFFGGKPGVYPGYAPASDRNNPAQYAATVAGWLGIDPNSPLSAYLGAPAGAIDAAGAGDAAGGFDVTGLLPGVSLPASSVNLALAGVLAAVAIVLLVTD